MTKTETVKPVPEVPENATFPYISEKGFVRELSKAMQAWRDAGKPHKR